MTPEEYQACFKIQPTNDDLRVVAFLGYKIKIMTSALVPENELWLCFPRGSTEADRAQTMQEVINCWNEHYRRAISGETQG